jgi:putative ABC transport system permease protein
MRFGESLRIGSQALFVNKARSLVTTLGIIVGVAAVVCTISISSGAQQEISETLGTLGANLLLVMPGAQNSRGVQLESGTLRNLTDEDVTAIRREIPGVEIAAPLVSGRYQVVAGDKNWATLVAGINPDYLVAREWHSDSGRFFDYAEAEAGARLAVIGADVASVLFADHSAIAQEIRINNVRFQVISVLAQKGIGSAGRSQDDVVFVPLAAARSRLLGSIAHARTALDLISLKVDRSSDITETKVGISELLRHRHQLRSDAPDDFIVENPADLLNARADAANTLRLLLVAVASVSLIVGGIGVMNIMLVTVGERTREIGIRMAVGARRGDIVRQLLAEAVMLTLAGGFLGSIVGVAGAYGVAQQAGWNVFVSPIGMLMASALAGLVGLMFGSYPAYKAARLEPMVALRYE